MCACVCVIWLVCLFLYILGLSPTPWAHEAHNPHTPGLVVRMYVCMHVCMQARRWQNWLMQQLATAPRRRELCPVFSNVITPRGSRLNTNSPPNRAFFLRHLPHAAVFEEHPCSSAATSPRCLLYGSWKNVSRITCQSCQPRRLACQQTVAREYTGNFLYHVKSRCSIVW